MLSEFWELCSRTVWAFYSIWDSVFGNYWARAFTLCYFSCDLSFQVCRSVYWAWTFEVHFSSNQMFRRSVFWAWTVELVQKKIPHSTWAFVIGIFGAWAFAISVFTFNLSFCSSVFMISGFYSSWAFAALDLGLGRLHSLSFDSSWAFLDLVIGVLAFEVCGFQSTWAIILNSLLDFWSLSPCGLW